MKNTHFYASLIACALLLFGCATSNKTNTNDNRTLTAESRALLIGKWCGKKEHTNGDQQLWTMHRHKDGTYKVEFHLTKSDGTQSHWGEYGIWGVRHPIYFTASRVFMDTAGQMPLNTNDPDLYDAYEIQTLTPDTFTYKSFASGNIFTVSKNCD